MSSGANVITTSGEKCSHSSLVNDVRAKLKPPPPPNKFDKSVRANVAYLIILKLKLICSERIKSVVLLVIGVSGCNVSDAEFMKYSYYFFFNWLYNPWWVLASLTTVHHPLIPIVARFAIMLSIHLILGRPLLLLSSLHFSILFGICVSGILSTCPSHLSLCALMNLTRSCPSISLSSS
jgi:hypothetical protein